MTGFLTCSSASYVYSGKGIAVAWDDYNQRTVNVWVNQNRLDNSDDRELMVSVGHINHYRLPEPDGFGVRSSVTPGLACKDNAAAGGYDCVVAYVDTSNSYNQVSVRRFINFQSGNRYYALSGSTSLVSNAYTSERIALWYANGKFWLALRGSSPGQSIAVYSSPDSLTWTAESYNVGTSPIGPSAVGYYTGSINILVYAN